MIMRKRFRAGIAGLFACASLVLTTGCLKSDDNSVQPQPPASYVSLYNASPDAPALDVDVDNRQINNGPFGYSDYTGYLLFYTGQREFRVTPRGADNVVIDTTLSILQGKAYSLFIVDDYNKASVLVLTDNSPTPSAGMAKVRLVNLSPDAGPVRLNEKGDSTAIVTSTSFKSASDFIEVNAKTHNLQLTSDGSASIDLEIPDANLEAGNYYTVLVRGYETPPAGNHNILSAEIVVN
jgi:hypothetical protein